MTNIFVHIGPPKTGTSALQFCFKQNAEELMANGIWYPQHRVDSNLVSSGNMHCIMSRDPKSSSLRRWRVDERKAERLLVELQKTGCEQLLLSSEFFWTEFTELQRVFPDAKFIAYLRSPIELLESNYNQGVKRHRTIKKIFVKKDIRFPTLATFSKLYADNGKSAFELRPYCDELYVGGRIETDIFSVLGVKCAKLSSAKINSSYSIEALEFKRMANYFDLGTLEPELDRALQGCGMGNMNYSLIRPEKYAILHRRCLRQLDTFIDAFELEDLEPFREHIASTSQKEFVRQHIDESALKMISEYLRLSEPSVYTNLQKLVRANPNTRLPNNGFYNCFDKNPRGHISLLARRVKQRLSGRQSG